MVLIQAILLQSPLFKEDKDKHALKKTKEGSGSNKHIPYSKSFNFFEDLLALPSLFLGSIRTANKPNAFLF